MLLIAEHTPEGAIGLVLNRPSPASVAESIDALGEIVDPTEPVFVGGPVQTEAVIVLAEFADPTSAAVIVVADVGFLRADADPVALADDVRRARVFAGHSGWGPGQLDLELAEGSWIVVDAVPDELLTSTPEDLWAATLVRRGGPYAVLARIPEDPSVN